MSDNFTFDGFEPANTTAVPDVFFDVLLSELSGAEIKVMLYIIRRTLGFKKTTDAISFNQFLSGITTKDGRVLDKGCGVKDRTTLSKALKRLEKLNCIETAKGETPQHDKDTTAYTIKFVSQGVVGKSYQGSREIIPPLVGKTDYPSREIIPGVVGKSYLQQTVIQQTVIQQTVIQVTERQEESTDASAIASAAPTPFVSQAEEAEEIRIATDTLEASEKAGQEYADDNHTIHHSHSGAVHHPTSASHHRIDLDAGTAQEVADENNAHSHGEVTQANSVGVVPHGRAKEIPAEEQKTPPRPQASPPVLKDVEQAKQSNLLTAPISEPRMTGPWDDEKCVQYAEWHKKRRYTDKMRPGQLQAAHLLNKEDSQLTLEQFKSAFDDWHPWWTENRGPLNVSDLRVKQKNGVQRYQTALDRLEMQNRKPKQQQRSQPQLPPRMPTREEQHLEVV